MRLVKAILFGLIVASLAMVWTSRDYVTEAYRIDDEESPQLRLGGVDLAVASTDVGPSPFSIYAAPDVRDNPPPQLASGSDAPAPTVAMTGGTSVLSGVVVGPDGIIPAATVEIQRHTSHGIGTMRVVTDETGTWSVASLPGGRYRVRAWVPGLLTSGGSEVRYVTAGQSADYNFTLWAVDPAPGLEFVHGGPIYEGQPGEVAVAISRRSIDETGVVVTTPIIGALVSVETTADVTVVSAPIQLSDGEGATRFTIQCNGPISTGTLTARSGALSETFPLPGCQPIPPMEEPTDG